MMACTYVWIPLCINAVCNIIHLNIVCALFLLLLIVTPSNQVSRRRDLLAGVGIRACVKKKIDANSIF